jgi:hypothetical protein
MVWEITDPWPGELTHAIPINTRWSSPSSWNALRKPACRQIRDISAGSPTELAAVSLNLFSSPRAPRPRSERPEPDFPARAARLRGI